MPSPGDQNQPDSPADRDVRRGRLSGFRVPYTRYRREDGLPSGQVFDLAQDIHQVFWFATPGGLARFDGARFRVLTPRDGLSSHGLRAVTADRDGSVWVGSDIGIDHVAHDGRVLSSSSAGDWHYGPVDCIHLIGGEIWLGSAGGLLRRQGRDWERFSDTSVRSMAVTHRRQDGVGIAWCVTADGRLLRQRGTKLVDPQNEQWQRVGPVRCIFAVSTNTLMVGGAQGLVEIDEDGSVIAELNYPDAIEPVSALCRADGDLWAGIGQMFCRLRRHDRVWEISSVVSDHDGINNIVVDASGGIWGATDGGGIVKVSPLHEMIRPLSLPRNKAVLAVKPGHGGKILLGGDQFSAVLHQGGSPGNATLGLLDHHQTWDIAEDDDGALWAATEVGLMRLAHDDVEARPLFVDKPVVSRSCRALIQRQGDIWVGGKRGLAIVTAERSVRYPSTDTGEPLGYVYTLSEDREGCLWVGTIGNGLWREQGDHFIRVVNDHLTATGSTYCIAVRDDNVLAVAQNDRLVICSPDGSVELLHTSAEPIAGWALQWARDGERLWAGSASGLHAYNVIEKRLAHQITAVLGLSQWEFTTSRSLHVTDSGLVYCGLNSGLVVVDPQHLNDDIPAPVARAARVEWTNVEPTSASDGAFEIDTDRWSLRVALCCPWFLDEQDVQYRYRMVGFEESWSELSAVPEARYSSLPVGEYRLEVQAFSRLVGFGPASRLLTLRVVDGRLSRNVILAPLRAVRTVRDTYRAMRRNRLLLDENTQLEEEIGSRTAELVRAKDKLQQLNASLTQQVTTDALTGISSRRHFDTTLERLLRETMNKQHPLSMLFIDIDHFKAYNDRYGHTKGDECLGFVARRIEANLYRTADSVARYGGEEFGVLSPRTDVGGAMALAERLRESVVRLKIRNEGAPGPGYVTVSVGVTTLPSQGNFRRDAVTPQKIIANADRALYQAKENGRNQCVFKEFDFTLR
ncbi:MAG: diguanylate cyclase [Gammaproteobacteria bacterium]